MPSGVMTASMPVPEQLQPLVGGSDGTPYARLFIPPPIVEIDGATTFHMLDASKWEESFQINLKGTYYILWCRPTSSTMCHAFYDTSWSTTQPFAVSISNTTPWRDGGNSASNPWPILRWRNSTVYETEYDSIGWSSVWWGYTWGLLWANYSTATWSGGLQAYADDHDWQIAPSSSRRWFDTRYCQDKANVSSTPIDGDCFLDITSQFGYDARDTSGLGSPSVDKFHQRMTWMREHGVSPIVYEWMLQFWSYQQFRVCDWYETDNSLNPGYPRHLFDPIAHTMADPTYTGAFSPYRRSPGKWLITGNSQAVTISLLPPHSWNMIDMQHFQKQEYLYSYELTGNPLFAWDMITFAWLCHTNGYDARKIPGGQYQQSIRSAGYMAESYATAGYFADQISAAYNDDSIREQFFENSRWHAENWQNPNFEQVSPILDFTKLPFRWFQRSNINFTDIGDPDNPDDDVTTTIGYEDKQQVWQYAISWWCALSAMQTSLKTIGSPKALECYAVNNTNRDNCGWLFRNFIWYGQITPTNYAAIKAQWEANNPGSVFETDAVLKNLYEPILARNAFNFYYISAPGQVFPVIGFNDDVGFTGIHTWWIAPIILEETLGLEPESAIKLAVIDYVVNWSGSSNDGFWTDPSSSGYDGVYVDKMSIVPSGQGGLGFKNWEIWEGLLDFFESSAFSATMPVPKAEISGTLTFNAYNGQIGSERTVVFMPTPTASMVGEYGFQSTAFSANMPVPNCDPPDNGISGNITANAYNGEIRRGKMPVPTSALVGAISFAGTIEASMPVPTMSDGLGYTVITDSVTTYASASVSDSPWRPFEMVQGRVQIPADADTSVRVEGLISMDRAFKVGPAIAQDYILMNQEGARFNNEVVLYIDSGPAIYISFDNHPKFAGKTLTIYYAFLGRR